MITGVCYLLKCVQLREGTLHVSVITSVPACCRETVVPPVQYIHPITLTGLIAFAFISIGNITSISERFKLQTASQS